MPATQLEVSDASGRRTRSPLARLSSAFSTKPRNLSGFNIALDEPHRRYAPGDAVNGHLDVTVHKVTRLTHIVLSLLGYVKVYKHPVLLGQGVPADVVAPSTGRGRRGTEYHGNGQALLFEEETIICGDGRVTQGRYAFKFSIRFPSRDLPSSLDFERGTITYSLVATLTRPTTIAPTITCDRKIYLQESIDVALQKTPKPDLITITQIVRTKTRRRARTKTDDLKEAAGSIDAESTKDGPLSEAAPSQDGSSDHPARRDSADTSVSSNNPSIERPRIQHSNSTYEEAVSAKGVLKGKTITARVELLRGGYMSGDYVPVRVMVQHTKFVKSMPGVIITLYRVGRIDRYPLLPVVSPLHVKNADPAFDPKAQVGLEGLSLSAADKSHSFRMDLEQNVADMIVNPNTLQADIRTGVRIPEGLFPTITGVPGRMITFTYHVEVVMDLHGKLASSDGIMPRINMTGSDAVIGPESDFGSTIYTANGTKRTFMNTSKLRREKCIATSTFEIVVGTRDSARRATKKASDPWDTARQALDRNSGTASAPQSDAPGSTQGAPASTQGAAEYRLIAEPSMTNPSQNFPPPPPPPPVHELIPLPPVEDIETEKDRIRAHEERLLPSAPPVAYTATPPPSAPTLEDIEAARWSSMAAAPPPPDEAYGADLAEGSSHALAIGQRRAAAGDDKQELERQRLLAQASSPYDGEEHAQVLTPSSTPLPAGSAPFFDENGDFVQPSDESLAALGDEPDDLEHLPRYQR